MSERSDEIENAKDRIGPDSFGCLSDLREALALVPLDAFATAEKVDALPEDSRRAAYEVAVALGYCRLFGVEPGAVFDGALPPLVAEAAVEVLRKLLVAWTEDARNLERDWNDTDEPMEAEDLAIGLVKVRMQAWAADTAIAEAYSACIQSCDANGDRLGTAVDSLASSFDEFDHELGQQIEWLSLAAGTRLLSNWRGLLAEPYALYLPWWLDGSLEIVSERLSTIAQSTQPSQAAWHRLQKHPKQSWETLIAPDAQTRFGQSLMRAVDTSSNLMPASGFFDRLSEWMAGLFSSLSLQASYSDGGTDEVIKTFPPATSDAYEAQLVQDTLGRWFLRVFTKDAEAAKLKLRLEIEPEAPEMQFTAVAPAMFFAEVRLSESMAQALKTGHRPVFRTTD